MLVFQVLKVNFGVLGHGIKHNFEFLRSELGVPPIKVLGITFFLSPDFHEFWHSVRSTCLITEVKQQWTMLLLGLVTTSVHYWCL